MSGNVAATPESKASERDEHQPLVPQKDREKAKRGQYHHSMQSSKDPNSMHPTLQVDKTHHKVAELSPRFRAPALLFFGAATCILGFILVTVIGLVEFFLLKGNPAIGIEQYQSNWGYFPATMSEMVYNQDSPSGKIFHTFGIMSGMCIFMSWYPLHLRNVYTGKHMVPFFGIYWTTARQILPAMGLYLLIGVNTYPTPIAVASPGKTKMGCVLLHLVGAGMMFVGYLVCEWKCVGLSVEEILGDGRPCADVKDRERVVRKFLAIMILVFFVSFCGLQGALVGVKVFKLSEPGGSFCCADSWILPGTLYHRDDDRWEPLMGDPQVNNTATGLYLFLKVSSFFCEDIAGLALVISHLVVWYYCEERKFFYGEFDLEDTTKLQDEKAE